MRNRLRGFVERGTDQLEGRADILALRRVNALILIGIVATAFYTLQNLVLGFYELAALQLGALVVMPVARLWALRDPRRRVRIAMHFVLGMFTFGLAYTVWMLGPLTTSSLQFSMVILVAAYALGVRAAIIWTAICVGVLAMVTLPVDDALLKNGAIDTSLSMFWSRALFLLAIMGIAITARVVADRWAAEVEASLAAEAGAHAQTLLAKERAEAATADAVRMRQHLELANRIAVAAQRDAQAASRAKSEFLSRVSHELRTPLNAIMGFSELVTRMGDLNERDADWVAHIHDGGEHLLTLIEDVLDVSRIESGTLDLEIGIVNVEDVIAEVSDLIAPLASASELTFTTAVSGSDLWVSADMKRLKQILINLASNAIKYNTAGGTVSIVGESCASTVRVAVADTGIGIPEHQLEHIFVPFDRLGAERTQIEGTGIGLTIARSLAEALGGSLCAVSRPGEGSTFSIELPRVDVPRSALAELPSTRAALPFPRSRAADYIVYIEDDATNAELVVQMLDDFDDVELAVFGRARLALDHLQARPADLLLLDLHLPDMEPAAILEELRNHARTAKVPIIVVTADATQAARQQMARAGVTEYVTKPIHIDELLSAIATALGIRLPDRDRTQQS